MVDTSVLGNAPSSTAIDKCHVEQYATGKALWHTCPHSPDPAVRKGMIKAAFKSKRRAERSAQCPRFPILPAISPELRWR